MAAKQKSHADCSLGLGIAQRAVLDLGRRRYGLQVGQGTPSAAAWEHRERRPARSVASGHLGACHAAERQRATARGFEPLRAEPNGFLVHHLSHSVTLSHMQRQARLHDTTVTEMHREPNSHASADVDRQFKQQSPLQHEASVAASSAACLPHWQPSCRQRGDSSPCGQSPMDF